MGEIAEMMLEGLLDEETGELIDGDAPGYPRRMSEATRPMRRQERKAHICRYCGKGFKDAAARSQHIGMAHFRNNSPEIAEAGADLVAALERYGFPASEAALLALRESGSAEANALHDAAAAFRAALEKGRTG